MSACCCACSCSAAFGRDIQLEAEFPHSADELSSSDSDERASPNDPGGKISAVQGYWQEALEDMAAAQRLVDGVDGSIPSEPEERESSFPEPRGGHGPEADCQAGCANELADGIRVDNATDRWDFPTTLRARVDFTSNASRARAKRHFSFSACESQGRC